MNQQTEPEPFSYEWFCNLTDKELSDIAMLEATWDHSHFNAAALDPQQRALLAALAKRIMALTEKEGK